MSFISAEFVNHKSKPMVFRWKLLDRAYAQRWLELMRSWKTTWPGDRPNWIEKWFVASTEDDLAELISSLRGLVAKVDTIGVYRIGFDENIEKNTVQELNRLHRAFHEFIERTNLDLNDARVVETIDLCHRLNDLVHLCESAFQNTLSPFQSLCIIGTGQPHMHVAYDERDYQFYNPSRVSGWLYLGYATPGKNLYQCFEDRDVAVIQNRLVRPSQGIANEFHLELNGHDVFDTAREELVRKQYYEWCDMVGAERFGYDCRKPINNPGRIPLAEPLDDVNRLVHHIGGRVGFIKSLNLDE